MNAEEKLKARIASETARPCERELSIEGDLDLFAVLMRIHESATPAGSAWTERLASYAPSTGDWVLPSDHGGVASINGTAHVVVGYALASVQREMTRGAAPRWRVELRGPRDMVARAAHELVGAPLLAALAARLAAARAWGEQQAWRFVGSLRDDVELIELLCACLGLPSLAALCAPGGSWYAATPGGEGAMARRTMSGAVPYDCEYLTVEAINGEGRLAVQCGGYFPASMSAVAGGYELPLTLFAPSQQVARATAPAVLRRLLERGYRQIA